MRKYQSHKIVEACKITPDNSRFQDNGSLTVMVDGRGWHIPAARIASHTPEEVQDGYIVVYPPDHFVSWSPAKAFEDGYTILPNH